MSGTRGSRSVCALTVVLVLTLMASGANAAGLLVPRDGRPPIKVRSHRVSAVLADGLARTTIRQTFINPYGRSLEAVYLFPVPEGAALVDVAMEVGGRRLEGLLVERSRARAIYDEIVASRRDPALVEKIGRGHFRLSVFPVMPKQRTIVELTWIEQVPLRQGVYRYVYPLAIGGTAERTRRDFSFSLTVDSTVPLTGVTSPVKDLAIEVAPGGKTATAGFERRGARLDRDIVVEAAVAVSEPTLTVRTYRGEKGHGYFVAIVTPPAVSSADLVPRDVILMLDTSGSMRGDKLAQARAAALQLVSGLRDVDRVNILGFGTEARRFAAAPVPATAENRAKAAVFLKGLEAGGVTGLGDALKEATAPASVTGRVRAVVLLTDGLPTSGETEASRLVELAREGGQKGLRIFCFGIGDDVNPALLEGIGAAGAGGSEVLLPAEDVAGRLGRFLDRTATPVLSDLEIEVEGAGTYDVFPRPIPAACLGEQIVAAGRYREGGTRKVTLRATLGNAKTVLTREVEFATEPGGRRSVMQLFAAEKLAYLESEMRKRSGLSDAAYFAAIDRGDYAAADEIIDEMIDTSLDCGVQCAYTSFLVLLPEDRWRVDPEDEQALAEARERAAKAKQDAGSPKNDGPAEPGAPEPAPEAEGEAAPSVPPSPVEPDGPDSGGSTEGQEGSDPREDPPEERHPNDPPPEGEENPPPSEEEEPPPEAEEGGPHRGPAGDVPPGDRDPDTPQPGSEGDAGGGEGSPGDGGTATPTPPTPPPPSGAGTGLGGAAPIGPGGRKKKTATPRPEGWTAWWRLNRDAILADAAGRGLHRAHPPADPKTVEALRGILADTSAASDLRGAAAIALARIEGTHSHPVLVGALKSGPADLAVSAALGLGVTGTPTPAVRSALLTAARDSGRDVRVRIASMLALGLLKDGAPEVIVELLSIVYGREPDEQFPAAAIHALGLIGDEGFVPRFSEWLTDGRLGRRRLSSLEKVAIVDALGRIGHRRSIYVLMQALLTGEPDVQRSAAIALGRVVPRLVESEQVRRTKTMMRLTRDRKDGWLGRYLTISLGRIAASEESYPRVRRAVVAYLGQGLRERKRFSHASTAALALGLAAPACPREDREALRTLLRRSFAETRWDTLRAATLLGLGLARDRLPETEEILLDSARRRRTLTRRGALTALGLLEASSAETVVRDTMRAKNDPELTVAAADAAGLLGSPSMRDMLVEGLRAKRVTDPERRAIAMALGRMGHANAAPKLRDLLLDGSAGDGVRAGAALALGHLHARAGTVPLHRLTTDLNHTAIGKGMLAVVTWE